MRLVNVKLLGILRQRGANTRFFCRNHTNLSHQVPVHVRPQLVRAECLSEKLGLLRIRARRIHPAVVSVRFFANKRSDPPR